MYLYITFYVVHFYLQAFLVSISSDSVSGAQDLDSIRLSTYRTACKLRFVQKKCNCEYDAMHFYLWYYIFLIIPIGRVIFCLLSSAFGWHLECHRGFPREWPQHYGTRRWALRCSSRGGTVHHYLPAEQTYAHHPPDQRGSVHQPAAQLPAGSLWPVSNVSHDSRGCLCAFTSEVLTWVNVAWNVSLKCLPK